MKIDKKNFFQMIWSSILDSIPLGFLSSHFQKLNGIKIAVNPWSSCSQIEVEQELDFSSEIFKELSILWL